MGIEVVGAPTNRLASGAWAGPVNGVEPSPVCEPSPRFTSALADEMPFVHGIGPDADASSSATQLAAG